MSINLDLLIKKAQQIYVKPKVTYTYEQILLGVDVEKPSGGVEKFYAIESDTWRAFSYINNPGSIFKDYLLKNKKNILDKLSTINSVSELDSFANKMIKDIKQDLEKNTLPKYKPDTLNSYNRMRQPIDLFIEHIVAMATELDGLRGSILRHLFLPLGKQIFSNKELFSAGELKQYNLKVDSTFGQLVNKDDYKKIQEKMNFFAQRINQESGQIFNKIYFDLLWEDRYKNEGGNLFQLNADVEK